VFIGRRKDRQGQIYYSFSYIDPTTRKRVRMPKSEHPFFDNEEDARDWALSQDAQRMSRLAMVKRREAWRTTYYDFEKLFVRYDAYLRERQPRSFATYLTHFENYAMVFFLGERKASNVNNWHLLFPDFRDWLKKKTTQAGKPLAPSTRNHIIVSVNNFLAMLMERGLMDADNYRKCGLFPISEDSMKDASSVVSKEEYDIIKTKLRAMNKDAAEAFIVLYNTGMRLNEFMGLNLKSLFPGDVSDDRLTRELTKADKNTYYGYIHLMHQPAAKHIVRDAEKKSTFKIARAPLKGRKSITHRNSRIIPIFDKETWNILASRYVREEKKLENEVWGTDEESYLLFEGLAISTLVTTMQRAYDTTGFAVKSPHSLRHTYATMLVGETGSPFLARLILGHRKEAVLERYLHIYEQISQAVSRTKRKIALAE